jgi:hypothetical protein
MFGKRKRQQSGQGIHESHLAAGWIETPLTAIEGAFQAFGSGALSNAVSFYATDGTSQNVSYPFPAFDYVQIEQNDELHEAVRTKHAQMFTASNSPDHLIGHIGDGQELYVMLPMESTSAQWIELFRRKGVKVLPSVEWVEWDASQWDETQRERLTARLNADEVPFRWNGDLLQSGKQNQQAITTVLASIGLKEQA